MPPDPVAVTVKLSECDRQLVLLALAKLSLDRPGWEWTLNRLALTMDNPTTDPEPKASLFENFRQLHRSAAKLSPDGVYMALEESVRLQSHYAKLLNGWDGGLRNGFESASAWIARLVELELLPEEKA